MSTFKKLLALGTVVTLVMGSSVTAFAGNPDATANGTGTAEYEYINTDVYSATVPSAEALAKIATYTVDTEGLVKQSGKLKYADLETVDDSKGVMFKNYNADQTKTIGLSPVSDPIKVVNKSSDPIDVKLDVQVTSLGDITKMATADDYVADAEKEMYLAYYSDPTWQKALTTAATDVTTYDVIATAEEFYKVGYASNAYTYTIDSNAKADDFPTHNFYLTGSANFAKTFTKGTDTAKSLPTIKVTYTINLNKSKDGQAEWNGSTLWFSNKTGALPKAKDISGIKLDGKAVTIASVKSDDEGWASITWEQIYKAYDATWTSADKVPAAFSPTHIEFTCDGVTYIAPIK